MPRLVVTLLALAALGLAWFALDASRSTPPPDSTATATLPAPEPAAEETLPAPAASADFAPRLQRHFNRAHIRADESILTFRDAAALEAFLARAAAAGVSVLGRIDSLNTVRVRISDYAAFARELSTRGDDYAAIAANALLAPPTPPVEARAARTAIPVGDRLLATLGITTDNSTWGRGVTIAILDGGVVSDSSFGARLRTLDIGYGTVGGGTDGAHATSVAALAAGAAPDASGVSPAAGILSIRVTGSDGSGDVFSVAQGIYAAVDAGAQIINISLGGYATSAVLAEAVDYALASNVAIVASAGNDQVAQLVWPAAYSGVVSVGAVDAIGQQAIFSNSGASLQLTAPGYAITTVGAGGSRVSFSGTSASAPVVSGAIATLLSTTPGLNALQAADLLATQSTDSGPPGPDPAYGRGTLNLGRALQSTAP